MWGISIGLSPKKVPYLRIGSRVFQVDKKVKVVIHSASLEAVHLHSVDNECPSSSLPPSLCTDCRSEQEIFGVPNFSVPWGAKFLNLLLSRGEGVVFIEGSKYHQWPYRCLTDQSYFKVGL